VEEIVEKVDLYFYNARYYDPEIGRFVTPDTVVDGEDSSQGWNRFAYCKNNPIIYKDPTGHKLYNVVITGDHNNRNYAGHNLTLHVDDKTGVETYWEVTGSDSKNAHVYKLTKDEFLDKYKDRLDTLKNKSDKELEKAKKNFKTTESDSGFVDEFRSYDVVEAKEVKNEKNTLKYFENMFNTYGEGKKKWSYKFLFDKNKDEGVCTTFSWKGYAKGGKEYTNDTDIGEMPDTSPNDLNQAIRKDNLLSKVKNSIKKIFTND
jgi:RHS repeat-associated protein